MENLSEKQRLQEMTSTISSRRVFEGKLISVTSDKVADENDNIHTYDIVNHPGAVVIIPIKDDGNLI